MGTMRFSLDNPDKMEATLQYTLTIKAWKELHSLINKGQYEGSQFCNGISDIIQAAEKHFNEYDVEKLGKG